jgi:hypothetical protein
MDDHIAPSSRKVIHGRGATRLWPSVVEMTGSVALTLAVYGIAVV